MIKWFPSRSDPVQVRTELNWLWVIGLLNTGSMILLEAAVLVLFYRIW